MKKQKKPLLEERKRLAKRYEQAVKEWALAGKETNDKWLEFRKTRDEVATELKANYWKLDPYIRARSVYDRNGEMKSQNPDSSSE